MPAAFDAGLPGELAHPSAVEVVALVVQRDGRIEGMARNDDVRHAWIER